RNAIARGPIYLVAAILVRMHGAIGVNGRIASIDRATVRVFRRLRDPEPALWVPVERNHLLDQWFGRDEADIELRVDIQLCGRLLRRGGTTGGISQRIQFLLRAQIVHVRDSGTGILPVRDYG